MQVRDNIFFIRQAVIYPDIHLGSQLIDQTKNRKKLIKNKRRWGDISGYIIIQDILNNPFQNQFWGIVKFQFFLFQQLIAHNSFRIVLHKNIRRKEFVGLKILLSEFYKNHSGPCGKIQIMLIFWRNQKTDLQPCNSLRRCLGNVYLSLLSHTPVHNKYGCALADERRLLPDHGWPKCQTVFLH